MRISTHAIVAHGEVRHVGRCRLFKKPRRDQHEAHGAGGKLIEQPMIRGHELRQLRDAVERFHLAELRDHHRRADRFELLPPRAEVQFAFLQINRVRIHRHRAEHRLLLGERLRQHRLQLARLRLPHKVRPPHEDHRLLFAQRELSTRKRRRHRRHHRIRREAVQWRRHGVGQGRERDEEE